MNVKRGMLVNMENIILKINGMKCTGCSQRVEKALKNTDGVEEASVNLETREVNKIKKFIYF